MALRNSGGGMALVSEEESGDLHSLELDEDEESAAMPSLSLSLTSHRRTQRVDIFSLGCVFYCVLVPGEHPYGQWFEREANIMVRAVHPANYCAIVMTPCAREAGWIWSSYLRCRRRST
jgi:serine/threonine protein kinase